MINITPDSFSDGGNFLAAERAVDHALQLLADGADVLDIGGESTRPGATPVSVDEEIRRVVPVIREILVRKPGARISIDTTKSEVASAALAAGASIVNDVSAHRLDPRMAKVCADARCTVILMHSRGETADMASYAHAQYDPSPAAAPQRVEGSVAGTISGTVASESSARHSVHTAGPVTRHEVSAGVVPSAVTRALIAELLQQVDLALEAGIAREAIILDPGIGFAKRTEHSIEALAHLPELVKLGFPVLVGVSRKRFIGELTGVTTAQDRDSGTVGANVAALALGARWFRVHNVLAHRHALDVAHAILDQESAGPGDRHEGDPRHGGPLQGDQHQGTPSGAPDDQHGIHGATGVPLGDSSRDIQGRAHR